MFDVDTFTASVKSLNRAATCIFLTSVYWVSSFFLETILKRSSNFKLLQFFLAMTLSRDGSLTYSGQALCYGIKNKIIWLEYVKWLNASDQILSHVDSAIICSAKPKHSICLF